jgi:hypothetical protein
MRHAKRPLRAADRRLPEQEGDPTEPKESGSRDRTLARHRRDHRRNAGAEWRFHRSSWAGIATPSRRSARRSVQPADARPALFEEIELTEWRAAIEGNLIATFLTVKASCRA